MTDYQIRCSRPSSRDMDRRTDAVGLGSQLYSIGPVIAWIQTGIHRFWTVASGQSLSGLVKKALPLTDSDGFPPPITRSACLSG